MGKFGEKIRRNNTAIFQAVLLLGCIALIVYLFPSQAAFKYEYSEGKPWQHETLFAPFEFSIRKSAEEIDAEKSVVRLGQKPYYYRDEEIVEEQLKQLRISILENWNTSELALDRGTALQGSARRVGKEEKDSLLRQQHIETAESVLAAIFRKGVIDLKEAHVGQGSDFVIVLLDAGVAEEVELGTFLSIQDAAGDLRESLLSLTSLDIGFLLDQVENALAYNILFDERKTKLDIEGKLSSISLTHGKVWEDEKIIAKGEVVSRDKQEKLNSLKLSYDSQVGGSGKYYWVIAGQVLLLAICMFALVVFFYMFRPEVLQGSRKLVFILSLIILMTFLTRIAVSFDFIGIYVVPFCLVPIILRAFYDTRLAIFVHLIICLIVAFLVPNQYEFVFIQILVGLVVSFSIVRMTRRVHFYLTAGVVFLCYAVTYTGFSMVQEGDLMQIDAINFAWFGGNALFSLFAYPFIYLVERIFGFVSEVTLMELSDTNSPLLREISAKAPGTFQHSLQVSNLAEAAIREIGGDALLVRTGALYHDLGKIERPLYFIENQSGGTNPHNDINYKESARIIIQHVVSGIELGRKHNLPEIILDFIRTHHGTTRAEYFYKMYLKQLPANETAAEAEAAFCYPGPLPSTKEMAVLMMADSVEAASKSLKTYNASNISELVDSIIDHQMETNQFVKAPITFKDIATCRGIFKKMLMNIYHVRVEYPE